MQAPINRLTDMIREARAVVAFTGAGISTECGIPDFRSPGGFWATNQPIEFDDFVASSAMRREAWARRFRLEDMLGDVKPGRGHKAIAHLVKMGKVSHVITQNIDNLHQDSGVPPEKIVELHGNGTYAKCLDCQCRYELSWVRERFETNGEPPDCAACGGLVKSATISFGQAMPELEMARAEQATRACDMFIVIGSSLVVYPAAGFPLIARRGGARLVIINRDPTDLDPFADLVINDDIGDVMEPLMGFSAS